VQLELEGLDAELLDARVHVPLLLLDVLPVPAAVVVVVVLLPLPVRVLEDLRVQIENNFVYTKSVFIITPTSSPSR
jgi:hypothetical protein